MDVVQSNTWDTTSLF